MNQLKPVALLAIALLAGCSNIPSREQRLASGSAADQYQLHTMYANGRGVEQDFKKSRLFLEKAAQRGDKGGQYTLAIRLDQEGDYEGAVEWYKKAASDGINRHAQHRLAEIYDHGYLGEQDLKKAMHYYLNTAKAGYRSSAYRVAEIYYSQGKFKMAYIWAGAVMQGEWLSKARNLKEKASFEMEPLEALKLEKQVRRYRRLYLN